jgi:nucleoid-associated protein YgaU
MWFQKKERFADMGKTKKSTSSIIDNAVSRQNSWMARRSAIAIKILRRLNIFAKPNVPAALVPAKKIVKAKQNQPKTQKQTRHWILAYWFPIVCALSVMLMLLYVLISPKCSVEDKKLNTIPEPTIQPIKIKVEKQESQKEQAQEVKKTEMPSFDIVRIGKDGKILIAGRWLPNHSVSIKVNNKIISTEKTDANGEFVYSPIKNFSAGNYTIRLSGVEQALDSESDVFVYVSERGSDNSMSLLMDKDGSKFLQSPILKNGDLKVTKIDYLETQRIVVQGVGIPRTRVTMALDDKILGMAHVSDHKNFGLGANIGELKPGNKYTIRIQMHDGSNKVAALVKYEFTMPQMLPGDDTWYVVRRDDSLWIIARNFLGRGIRYTMIVDENKIENPNLIFPKQKLKIPVTK